MIYFVVKIYIVVIIFNEFHKIIKIQKGYKIRNGNLREAEQKFKEGKNIMNVILGIFDVMIKI